MEWLIQLTEGLGGAGGIVIFIYSLGAWFAFLDRKAERDYDEPNELERAKETFALTGTRAAYRRMLSLVTAPDVLTWYNSADEDEADRAAREWRASVAKSTGIQVVNAETQAMWSDMAEATELRSGGIVADAGTPWGDYARVGFPELPGAFSICDCNACRISRREFPTT